LPLANYLVLPGRFLNSMLGPSVIPWTGFPASSTTIPPTDQAGSSSAVSAAGMASVNDSEFQLLRGEECPEVR
jgi:hypothetical protein